MHHAVPAVARRGRHLPLEHGGQGWLVHLDQQLGGTGHPSAYVGHVREQALRQRLGELTPGTVVAMVAWLVVSALFAAYTANFASYGKTYGALASIVVVLLWLWLSCLVILVGAEIDGADEASA